jgi:hypothetical protein
MASPVRGQVRRRIISRYSLGLIATREFTPGVTFNQELSYIGFTENTYDDGNRTRFGQEIRANSALIYRAYTVMDSRLRVDLALKAQYLHLGRDETNGVKEQATGGDMVYGMPGVRIYWREYSLGLGYKTPIWRNLNEQDEQQGGEGTEAYLLVLSFSALF